MDSFNPVIKCPHCYKAQRPSISGWGGELSTRLHYCHYCSKPYTLVVYSTVSTDTENTPVEINRIKSRINHLKQRIYEKRNKLNNKYADYAEEFLRVEANSGGKNN